VAVETDLPGYRLGLRQVASVVAASALVAGMVPVALAALDGQWYLPRADLAGLFVFTKAERSKGSFRILWVGDPEALPLDGWHLTGDLAYGTTIDGPGDVTGLWPASDDGPTHLLADGIRLATTARTSRIGHLLAPMSVRYIAIPRRVAPAGPHVAQLPAARGLTDALDSQTDLRAVESDDSLVLYENTAWMPARSLLASTAARDAAGRGSLAAEQTDIGAAPPVLPAAAGTSSYRGPVRAGQRIFLSQSADPRWELRSGGRAAGRADAFGWANQFDVRGRGSGRLRYRTSPARYLALLVEVGLWVYVIRYLFMARRQVRNQAEAGVAA
jgi:hypothetical protein